MDGFIARRLQDRRFASGAPRADARSTVSSWYEAPPRRPDAGVVVSTYRASGRCWEGYEPVRGKEPYSEGSCKKKGETTERKRKRRKKKSGSGSESYSSSDDEKRDTEKKDA